jgi:hypothetical protein
MKQLFLFLSLLYFLFIIKMTNASVNYFKKEISLQKLTHTCITAWRTISDLLEQHHGAPRIINNEDCLDELLCLMVKVREQMRQCIMHKECIHNDGKTWQYIMGTIDCIESYTHDLCTQFPCITSSAIKDQVERLQQLLETNH